MKKISQIRGDTGREGLQQVAEEIRNTEESGTKKEKITEKAVVKNSNIFITICKYIIKGTGYLCLFLVPILSYYLFEYGKYFRFYDSIKYMLGLCTVSYPYRYYRNYPHISTSWISCIAYNIIC